MSTNLLVDQLAQGQAAPEVTVNNATGKLDAALTEQLAIDLTNNVALTAAQYRGNIYFNVTTTGATKTLTLPAIKRLVVIRNNGTLSFAIVVGSTSISLPIGLTAIVITDGTTNGLTTTQIASGLPVGGVGTPVAAAQTLTATGNFADGETVTIGTTVYTAQTVFTAGAGHFFIGAAAVNSLTNLARCINQTGAGGGTLYDTSITTAHPDVTATEASPMVATARLTGTEGNSIATTETSANMSWGSATLLGGKSKQVLAKNTNTDFDVTWVDLPRAGTGGGGGGGGSVTSLERPIVLPATATFPTALNATGVTFTDLTRGLLLSCASSAANHVRGRVKSVPAGDWTVYARFTRGWLEQNFASAGLVLRESGTSKLVTVGVGGDQTVQLIGGDKWTNPDTFSANLFQTNKEQEPRIWWQKTVYVSASTPNYSFYYSWDGDTWFLLKTMNKTDFFTTNADQIGIYLNPIQQTGSDTFAMKVSSWEETTP